MILLDKINAIKAYRTAFGDSLNEAKQAVELVIDNLNLRDDGISSAPVRWYVVQSCTVQSYHETELGAIDAGRELGGAFHVFRVTAVTFNESSWSTTTLFGK